MPECLRRLQLGKEDDVMEVRRPGKVRRVYYYGPIEGARKNARKNIIENIILSMMSL